VGRRRLTALSPFRYLLRRLRRVVFPGSVDYWEGRYGKGGDSGPGSYGELARFKAEVIEGLLAEHDVGSAIEFGCGDGHQLSLIDYPSYVGLDTARLAVARCRERFRDDASKSFFLYHPKAFADRQGLFRADLSVSLEVVFHIVEDDLYELYMEHLFAAARRLCVIFTSARPADELQPAHMRYRDVVAHVADRLPGWSLDRVIPNRHPELSDSEFYAFVRRPVE